MGRISTGPINPHSRSDPREQVRIVNDEAVRIDGDYLRVHNQQLQIRENDQGYGVKLSLIPYQPEWFHIASAEYHEKWLKRVCDPDDPTRHGSTEVYLHDDGSAALHLTTVSEVEVVVPNGVE